MKRWLWSFGVVLLSACKPSPSVADDYYFQINDVYLKIPGRYFSFFPSGLSIDRAKNCDGNSISCASKPPGLLIQSISFLEQDLYTFERYREPVGHKGPADYLVFKLINPESHPSDGSPSDTRDFWSSEHRSTKDDVHGLLAYKKKTTGDEISYRYVFEKGNELQMRCKGFSMPSPRCYVSTNWYGLFLTYEYRHQHLSEWKDIHRRINAHLNSFVQQN